MIKTAKPDGIFGHLKYDTDMVQSLAEEIERLRAVYPISELKVDLACLSDKRWGTWKEYNGKNGNGNSKKKSE
jgi:hypothetical protein